MADVGKADNRGPKTLIVEVVKLSGGYLLQAKTTKL